jgi:2-phospho-L-lactate guanylyltransferase
MPTIVVPFRGRGGKQRLAPLSAPARALVAGAMLGYVLAACGELGRPVVVVAPAYAHQDVLAAAEGVPVLVVTDPGRGQGAAVAAALEGVSDGAVLVVNADLPCVTARDLYALLGELPAGGVALAEARDGTTNALALGSPAFFEPLYGPGSATRFRALASRGAGSAIQAVPIPNLIDDVDTLDDLRRLAARLGPRTMGALVSLELPEGAAA